MSRITSLGIHTPAALPYCISENLLADPIPPNSYTWTTTPFLPNEELLVTSSAVIWSQGGIIRRVFRFEVEKQPVIQAVLTWFPSDDPADALLPQEDVDNAERSNYQGGPGEGAKRKKEEGDVEGRNGFGAAKKRISTWNSRSRTYGTQLGNFPKAKNFHQQMFGGGVGGLNSEEDQYPTPQGRARALVVFLKFQAHVYFLSGQSHVIHIPYEIQHAMPSPRGLILQIKMPTPGPTPKASFSAGPSLGGLGLNIPPIPTSSAGPDFPRLYALTDPLADLGMIITGNGSAVDPGEELIFISPNSELDATSSTPDPTRPKNYLSPEVIFAITRNVEKGQITVWFARYIPQEAPTNTHRRSSSGTATARRRSSFGPATGATTPVAGGGPGSIPLSGSQLSSQTSEDLAAEFEDKPARRTSRRVSSLVARSDLSQSMDRLAFSDMASAGSSFQQNDKSFSNDNAPPTDDLLNDLNIAGLGLGFGNMGIYDGNTLRKEVHLSKIESFPFECTVDESEMGIDTEQSWAGGDSPGTAAGGGISKLPRVFTLLAPSSVLARDTNTYGYSAQKVLLCIMNKRAKSLSQLTFLLQTHTVVASPQAYSSAASFSRRRNSGKIDAKLYTPVLTDIVSHTNVADAIKISDGGVSRILMLSSLTGELKMYSPWSPEIPLVLPATLARWNPNIVGGLLRKKKGGFARTLSTTPEKYLALEYAEEGGKVSVLDENRIGHRIGIQLAPREAVVKLALEAVKIIIGAMGGVITGEAIGVVWMEVSRSGLNAEDDKISRRRDSTASVGDDTPKTMDEWQAFVITILSLGVTDVPEKPKAKPKKGRAFARSASMVSNLEWEEMLNDEIGLGIGAEYLRNPAWEWMIEEQDDQDTRRTQGQSGYTHSTGKSKFFGTVDTLSHDGGRRKNTYIMDAIRHAREFMASPVGTNLQEHLPNCSKDPDVRKNGLAMVLIALHLVREELKLDITMEMDVRRMTPLLAQLARWLGWRSWVDWYSVEDIEIEDWSFDETRIASVHVPSQPFSPPSIYDWLISCFEGKCTLPFMSLQDIVTPTSSSPIASARSRHPYTSPAPLGPPSTPLLLPSTNLTKPIYAKLTPRTKIITELYATLTTPGKTHDDVVALMVKMKMTASSLERLPEGIALPLREAIARCQEQPPTTWGTAALDLVGRKDIKMLINPGKYKKEYPKWQAAPTHEAMRDVHTICSTTFETENIGTYDGSVEFDRQAVSRLIFREDRRVQEASKLLQSNKPAVARCIPDPDWTEQETLDAQKELAQHVALRTLAVAPGRGLLYYSSRIPLLTEKFPIAGFNLTCLMKPTNTTVSADKATFTEDKVCWAFFHAGVASGLSISKDAKEIDTSWIIFNKPPEVSNRHAGFLLALGLNGHLKSLATWHAFNYLTPKHTMTSVGLLLGLSASYLGTMDTTVTKLVSIHVMRLLPLGSVELNLNGPTQTAGVMAIGLLYCNTQHRRMSEIMLSEIEHIDVHNDSCVPTDNLRDEGYRLAAGFALGYINLGHGRDLRGLHDMNLLERLLKIAVGSKKVQFVHELDKATAGATVALALIYMKSNDESLARKIDVPDTPHLCDYVRPDILLLRTVTKHLIMWDKIEGNFEWIERNMRPFMRSKYLMNEIFGLDSEDLPFYNVIAGLCFSIALRFAGSGDLPVRDVLLHYLDHFIRLCNLPALNHDQRLTRATVRNCQDLLALSCATVMAGSGDLPVFRRLRKLHGRTEADVPYGSHLVAHLAIGALFLSGGNYTLGTSNLAIASLFCAFYPLFPNNILDNRSHLQAFRHFWVLAAEARCLVARDVETNRPCTIPITVTLKSGQEITKAAPCLLPELNLIKTVSTASPQHWTIVLDFDGNPEHLASFEKSQTIYVHKRSAYASTSTVFQATLQALEEAADAANNATSSTSATANSTLEWLLNLRCFSEMDRSERALVLPPDAGAPTQVGLESTIVDSKLVLEKTCLSAWNADRLRNIRLVFAFVDRLGEGKGLWLGGETVDRLRAAVWTAFSE